MRPETIAVICALSETPEGQRAFAAMADEQQESCIHCGAHWYSIHYRDGVCHTCQKKRLPGRSAIARRTKIRHAMAWGTILMVITVCLYLLQR